MSNPFHLLTLSLIRAQEAKRFEFWEGKYIYIYLTRKRESLDFKEIIEDRWILYRSTSPILGRDSSYPKCCLYIPLLRVHLLRCFTTCGLYGHNLSRWYTCIVGICALIFYQFFKCFVIQLLVYFWENFEVKLCSFNCGHEQSFKSSLNSFWILN